MKALLPPKEKRGLVLIDPPYEAQGAEFDAVLAALRDAFARWPTGTYAVWYPIKQRRTLLPFLRKAAALPAQQALVAELLVRPDDTPLRMNGSGMLILNPPWKIDAEIASTLPSLTRALGETGASHRLEWLKQEERV
jgi:23S rRNA (adenine2030-N6)-methyltransferase